MWEQSSFAGIPINWAWYGVALAGCAALYAYGAALMNSPSELDKRQGIRYMTNAVFGLVYGIVVAILLYFSSWLIWGSSGAPDSSAIAYAADRYHNATARLMDYVMDIGLVSRDLALAPILSALAPTWTAASWLANYCAQMLIYLFSAFELICRFMLAWGSLLLSAGIALVAVERLRSIGGFLVSSTCVLTVYAMWGATTPYVDHILNGLEFQYGGQWSILELIPKIASAAFWRDQLWGPVLRDGQFMAWTITFYTLTFILATALAAGVSWGLGGLARSLSARV